LRLERGAIKTLVETESFGKKNFQKVTNLVGYLMIKRPLLINIEKISKGRAYFDMKLRMPSEYSEG